MKDEPMETSFQDPRELTPGHWWFDGDRGIYGDETDDSGSDTLIALRQQGTLADVYLLTGSKGLLNAAIDFCIQYEDVHADTVRVGEPLDYAFRRLQDAIREARPE